MNYASPPSQPSKNFKEHTLTALDNQPYGCIKLNKSGRILEFNTAASALLGVHPSQAVGRCFFTELAPCANTPAFFGHFKSAMAAKGVLNKVIAHRFLMRTPSKLGTAEGNIRDVTARVHMFSSTDATGLPVVWVVTRQKVDVSANKVGVSTNTRNTSQTT